MSVSNYLLVNYFSFSLLSLLNILIKLNQSNPLGVFDLPIGNTKKSRSIVVQGTPLRLTNNHEQDYISLTDMVKNFEGGSALIEQWLKNKDTVLFLGVWEKINTPVLIPSNSRELKMKQVETVSTSLL